MAACDDAQSYGGFVDYTFQTTRGGKITLTPELKSQLIHVVQREGAPLIYIFKKPHAYLQIN